jgi:hypothetical protein
MSMTDRQCTCIDCGKIFIYVGLSNVVFDWDGKSQHICTDCAMSRIFSEPVSETTERTT